MCWQAPFPCGNWVTGCCRPPKPPITSKNPQAQGQTPGHLARFASDPQSGKTGKTAEAKGAEVGDLHPVVAPHVHDLAVAVKKMVPQTEAWQRGNVDQNLRSPGLCFTHTHLHPGRAPRSKGCLRAVVEPHGDSSIRGATCDVRRAGSIMSTPYEHNASLLIGRVSLGFSGESSLLEANTPLVKNWGSLICQFFPELVALENEKD